MATKDKRFLSETLGEPVDKAKSIALATTVAIAKTANAVFLYNNNATFAKTKDLGRTTMAAPVPKPAQEKAEQAISSGSAITASAKPVKAKSQSVKAIDGKKTSPNSLFKYYAVKK